MTRRLLMLLLVVLALGACGDDGATTESAPGPGAADTATATSSPRLLVNRPSVGFPDALVGGVLQVNDRDCFSLRSGPVSWVLLAPDGSAVLPDGSGITVPGFGDIAVGDAVESGGGYFQDRRARRAWEDCWSPDDDGVVLLAPGEGR